MAAPRVLGNIQESDPKVQTITTYLERLELHFDVNTVAAEKKVSALLYGIGLKVTKSSSTKPRGGSSGGSRSVVRALFFSNTYSLPVERSPSSVPIFGAPLLDARVYVVPFVSKLLLKATFSTGGDI